ncbi:hypothetical protein DFH08DRAFT_972945 [Mycena albidolilacea]|uniref:VCBS repeat-containing protein n=1 Tax=Mycena albidolilacea TaxID=1033008 RepID=A0AAD7EDD0_9AGAR|nr:hypothetical protein DFH08DRAFT_972945 [Mycena albidolilacea]
MDGSNADRTWIVNGGVGGRGGEGSGTGGDGGNGEGPQLTVEDAENILIHVSGDLNFLWTGNSATQRDIIPQVLPRLDDSEPWHRLLGAARNLRQSVVPAVAYDASFSPRLPRSSSNPEEYSTPFSSAQTLVLADFSSVNGGWRVDKHIHFKGDVRNIGRVNIVGFGDAGLLISRNNGDGSFGPSELTVADFGYNGGGWRIDRHLHFLADVTGDGLLDIVEFGEDQLLIRRNNGNGTFQSAMRVIDDFGYGQGWRVENHPRSVVDLTGDGRADIIGFGDNSVWVSYNNGNGTFQSVRAVIDDFGYGQGWFSTRHPRFVVDLTGDGRADIIGFGDHSVWVSYNNGNGTFQSVRCVIDDFGYSEGWRVEKHPRFVVDLTGDGRADIIGFGENSVWVSYNNGDGTFQSVMRVIDDFGYGQGWRVDKHPRFVVDLTGNGHADIIGFGENSVCVSYNNGGGSFGPVTKLIDNFAYSGGWTLEKVVRYIANIYR